MSIIHGYPSTRIISSNEKYNDEEFEKYKEIVELEKSLYLLENKGFYHKRYNYNDFERYEKTKQLPDFLDKFKKWKKGINYMTNRKITIGGKIHNQLEMAYSFDFITTIDNINMPLYIQETEDIEKKFKQYKSIKNKLDKLKYDFERDINIEINKIKDKISLLEKWEDYIEFEGIKYGISRTYNNIHRENNCLG